MRTLVCCIAKLENLYIREWVEWYKDKGFTNVCLYDNNDIDGERFEEVIGDYIESGFVILKDCRGKEKQQLICYQSCYDEYKNDYDWIGFFDADEFFDTDKKDVSKFLGQEMFKEAEMIRVGWKNFTDNGLLYANGDYTNKRFKTTVNKMDISNRISKVFIKGGQTIEFYKEPGGEHGQYIKCETLDCKGNHYTNDNFVLITPIWENGWLNHYRFRTMEEFCKNKLKKGYAHVDSVRASIMLKKKDFFEYNEWTLEKDDLFHKLVGTNNVVCCIFNYKHDENALSWYERCKRHFKTYIIDTNYLDNGGTWPFDEKNHNILKEHNLFYGGDVIKSYELLKENNGQWLLIITSDVVCDDSNFSRFIGVVDDVTIVRNDIGVWDPSAAKDSMCCGTTKLIPQNLHQFNHGIGVREVRNGEGWVELVKREICDEIMPKFNYTDNKFGWGINDSFNRVARKKGLKVVIDDRVTMYHPQGTGYSQQEADKEYAVVKSHFAEWGIAEPQDKKPEEIKTLVCCIGKNENRYIEEFVDYYKHLGVTKIRLYDNNDVDGEHFEDVIGNYIKDGFVEIVDYRGKIKCQSSAYTECYHEKKNDYDWILFIDCDEFLTFSHGGTIGQYLASPQFVNYDIIHVNWLTFGDNGLVHYEDVPLAKRFPKAIAIGTKISTNFPENMTIKSIVRGGLEDITWKAPGYSHTPITPLRCCNNVGFAKKSEEVFHDIDYQLAFIRHYSTKTAEEYADKMKRGFPDQEWDGSRVENLIETRFFRTNEITKEKVEVFKEKLGIDMSRLLPTVFEGEKSKDVKIYSLCYSKKNFNFLDDEVITPLQVGAANGTDVCAVKDNTGDNISEFNYFFIENTGIYWIWKNVEAKYKGQMQYRRPLQGVDGKMDFEDVFSKYDVITCEPFHHPSHKVPTPEEPRVILADTVEQGYAYSNCVDDLYILEMAIKMRYPEYAEDYDKYIKNGPNLYYSNGFILKNEDYNRYCEFLFSCLSDYLNFANIHNREQLIAHVKYNLEVGKYPRYNGDKRVANDENVVRWQSEIGGFLSERLWTLWLQHNFKEERILKLPYVKMEEGMYT